MADYSSIQKHIDHGRGIAARHLAQPYDVFRIQPFSSGNFLDAVNRIAQSVPAAFRKPVKSGDTAMETPVRQGTFWFEFGGDATPYQVGDVFVQNDPIYGAGATSTVYSTLQFNGFCLASHAPLKHSIAARMDRTMTVYRPNAAPLNNRWSPAMGEASPLVLTNGTFSLGALTSAPTSVPVGLMVYYRPYGPTAYDPAPGQVRGTLWYVYVPPLSGFTFKEGDRLIMSDGSRYIVFTPWNQEVSVVGSQLVVEREVSQA